MDTLYDMLGALPRDDAEALRVAFRKAVKGVHPDLHPGDPDAGIKFRQIVRANEILLDRDQRAVYDHLLVLAQREKDPASAHPIAAKVHRIASTVLVLVSASIVAVGGYFLFMHMSMALPSNLVASRATLIGADLTTRLSASIAAVSPADAPDPAAVNALIAAKSDATGASNVAEAMAMASADAETALPSTTAPADPAPDPETVLHLSDAIAAGDPEQVMQLDTKFTAPYADRGLLFFREKKDDHPFPDLPPLKRAEKPGRTKSQLATNGRARGDGPPKTVPLPIPRTVPRFVKPEPSWYTSSATFE
jgi:hypothetical protein